MNYKINDYKIRVYVSDGEIFINGRNDFYSEKVTDVKIIDDQNRIILAKADGSQGKTYSIKVFFNSKGDIENTVCTCGKNKCRHVAAVLFKIADTERLEKDTELINQKNNAFENICNELKRFDKKYNNLKVKNKISIIPILKIIDDNRCSLNLKISGKFIYDIENIYDFSMKMKNNELIRFKNNVSFSISEFKESSIKYIKYIDNLITCFSDFSHNVESFFGKSSVILSRQGIDDFFETALNDKINIKYISDENEKMYESNIVKFTDNELDFFIKLQKENDIFKIKWQDENIKIIDGLKYGYILKDDFLYKIDKEKSEIIKEVNDAIIVSGKNEIYFTKDDVDKFLYSFLNLFEKYNLFRNVDEVYDILNVPKPIVEFYFDEENGTIFLQTKFSYNDYEIVNKIFRDKVENLILNVGFSTEYANYYSMRDEEAIFELYNFNIEKIKKIGQVFLSDNMKNTKVKVYKNVMQEVKVYGNLLEIDFDFDDFDLEYVKEILKSYKIKKKFFRLKDGDFIDLQNSELKPMLDVIDEFDLSEKELYNKNNIVVPAFNALYLNEIISKGKNNIKTNSVFDEIVSKFEKVENNKYEIPEALNNVLRDYQKKGFLWLKALASLNFGGILADDMGLGKTIQIISVILSEDLKKPSIVICPTSLVYNWKNEFEKFAPSVKTEIIAGNPDIRHKLISMDFKGVFITTYETLKRDIKFYEGFDFRFIIADEAQNIKNSFTQNAKIVKSLMGDVKFALTGTPIENSITELWSIFDFVMPGFLGNRKKFKENYETPVIKYGNSDASKKLKRKTMPFILRRIKKDVLKELPEKSENILYCDMTDKQRTFYDASLINARNEIKKFIANGKFENNKFKILSHITRLRQICCHPSLFVQNYSGGSGKLKVAMETIKNVLESKHRILLFSQFTSMLNIIKDELEKEKISYFYIDGSTQSDKRVEMSDRFNNGENDVFLISLKAGGTGLNLIGADIVIHFDPWWNPAIMEQASDRAYRFGQMKNVQVIYLVAKNSIEEKIIILQNKKRELVKEIISDNGEILIGKMTKEDVIEIFNEK